MIKGARKIVVNDELFYYKIWGCISIVIQRANTGQKKHSHWEFKEKWEIKFTPADIRKMIENSFKFNENVSKSKDRKGKTPKSARLDHNRS